MSAIEKLANILVEQNQMAKECWSRVRESSLTAISTIISYLQDLISYFTREIELLEKIGLQITNEKEKIRNAKQNFEEIKNEILKESENLLFWSKLFQNLLEIEELRLNLYQAALRILALKKLDPLVKEYFGAIEVDAELEPTGEVPSGKAIKAHVRVKNLSSLLQKLKLYVAWYHPMHILSKYEEEEITLAPLGNTTRVYMHMPKAIGTHNIRITVFKGNEEVASLNKAFNVLSHPRDF